MKSVCQVSIILTSYNHAKYLREAIDSVLNQTFTDFEIIIWDDASVDQSWEIIQSYSDPRIKPFKNLENKIPAFGVNKSIQEVARGEYIAMHHSDDIWESEKLEKQMAFLETNPQIEAVFSWAKIIGEDGEPLNDKSHPYNSVFDQPNRNRHEWLNFFFYYGNVLCHPSILIRKTCYQECGYYRYGFAQLPDFDMWVRLCLKYDIHILPEKLVRFRVRAGELNVSGDRADARIRQQFEYLQIYENYLALQSPEELIKVFPNAQKYIKPDGFDSGFALAMVFLEANKFNSTNLFALNLLFQALNDPERAQKINDLYDFNLKKFIELTAVYDIFSVEKNSSSPWLNKIMRKIRSNSLLKTFWILRKKLQKNWR
jgi:glycosyltransferase involved in cell wall biosynthesis